MTQKRRKADSRKAIGETTALRWEPTHVTKPNPRVVPLQAGHVVDITLQEFVCAKQRSSCEVAVPQVGVSRDISAVGNNRGWRGFWGSIEVVSRKGFIRHVLVGDMWHL